MINRILELITGRDDLERVACREDLGELNAYLRTRRLLIPRRPRRFLDAANFTEEQLLDLIRQESEGLSQDAVDLWVLEMDGKRRLPAFSSTKKMQIFSSKISQQLNKVFGLACVEILLADIPQEANVDFVDLNPFSKKSWEVGLIKDSSKDRAGISSLGRRL